MKYHFGVDLPHYFVCYLKGEPDVLVKHIRQFIYGSDLNMELHAERTSELERLNWGLDQEEDGVCRFKLKCPLGNPGSVNYLFHWLKQITHEDVSFDQWRFPAANQFEWETFWVFEYGKSHVQTSDLGLFFLQLSQTANKENLELKMNDVRPENNHHLWTEQERHEFFQERQKEIDALKAALKNEFKFIKKTKSGTDKKDRLDKQMLLIKKQVELMVIRYTGKTQNISPSLILNNLLGALKLELIPVFENAEGLERTEIYFNSKDKMKGIVIDNEIYAEPQSPKYCFLFNDNYITRSDHQSYTSRTSPFVNFANADMPELWKLAKQYSALRSCYQNILAENEDANSSRCAIRLC